MLLIEEQGPVVRVTLNRPDVRNAFNQELIGQLTAWAESIRAGGRSRVAVLAGAGKVFCAGADLTWMSKMVAYSREENVRDAREMARMFDALDRLPIPLIGRIHGARMHGIHLHDIGGDKLRASMLHILRNKMKILDL